MDSPLVDPAHGSRSKGSNITSARTPSYRSDPNGLRPDSPTVTNERGGKQSQVDYRFDLIDQQAVFAMAQVLHEGASKYGANNWRRIEVDSHLNHLLMHVYAYLGGDTQDDHLTHAL